MEALVNDARSLVSPLGVIRPVQRARWKQALSQDFAFEGVAFKSMPQRFRVAIGPDAGDEPLLRIVIESYRDDSNIGRRRFGDDDVFDLLPL